MIAGFEVGKRVQALDELGRWEAAKTMGLSGNRKTYKVHQIWKR